MDKLVMIDSNIFIWGIKGQVTAGQDPSVVPKAKLFIQYLMDNSFKLLMPVPQMVEFLSFVPLEKQNEIRKYFDKKFRIAPFDEMAASKCAELIHLSFIDNKKKPPEHRVPRNEIKFDCMLVATAIVRGVEKIYTNDPHLKKFANGQIRVEDIPIVAVQQKMFK